MFRSKVKNGEKLERVRHSLAHLLAASVVDLWPDTKVTLGPAIENGFYYDFDFSSPISDKDLPRIEKKMREIQKNWSEFEERALSQDEAQDLFKDNPYKLELVNEIIEKGETITVYKSGNFEDLCRGGHTQNLSKDVDPAAFKLTHTAGAYWRGDEENKMLTRIYGVAFASKKDLDNHLELMEKAKERDHRKLGKELDLFVFSELVGSGLPLFTPRGTLIRDLLVEKLMEIRGKYGYQKITTPHLTKKDLYITSGHWEKFKEGLFHVKGTTDTEFAIKPMNCPHHITIYTSRLRSYRELPIRYAELGVVYRDEQAGELLGLSRVRYISQDDGHAFCRPDQAKQEIKNLVSVIREFFTAVGIMTENNYKVFLSVRDPKTPDKYLGKDEDWQKAQEALEEVAKDEKLPYEIKEGEAAFYGPKLDFIFKDALGRNQQLSTIQYDFNMPKRFKLEYVDKDSKHKTPIMFHSAIAGSLERFLAVLIEHFAGAFPFWLSPTQVMVLPITDTQKKYAEEVLGQLKEAGLRAEIDTNAETLGKKIRDAKMKKIPYLLVIGEKEMKKKKITVESRDDGDLGMMKLKDFLKKIEKENS